MCIYDDLVCMELIYRIQMQYSFYPKYIHAVTSSITIRLQCSLKTLCSQLQVLYIKFYALDQLYASDIYAPLDPLYRCVYR